MKNINEIFSEIDHMYHAYKSENNGEFPTAFYIQNEILTLVLKNNQNPIDLNKPTIWRPWYNGVRVYPVVRPDTDFKYGFFDQQYVESKRKDPDYRLTKLEIGEPEDDGLTLEYHTTHKVVEIPEAVLKPLLSRVES